MRRFLGIAAAILMSVAARSAQAAPPIEAYGRLPNIQPSQFRLSPNGERMAFVASTPQGRQLTITDLSGHVLASFATGKAKVRRLEWVGDDHFLLTLSATINTQGVFLAEKMELSQVLVGSLKSKKVFVALTGNKYLMPVVYGQWGAYEKDGHAYAYFSTITMEGSGDSHVDFSRPDAIVINHGWTDLYRVDLESGDIQKAAGGSKYTAGWAIASDGSIAGHAKADDETGDWRLYADPEERHLLYKTTSLTGEVDFTVGRRPGTLLLSVNGKTPTEIDTAKPDQKTELFKDYRDTIDYLRSADGYLAGVVVEADRPYAAFLDPAVQAKFDTATKPFKGKTIWFVSADRAWNKWLLLTQGDGDSGTYYLVDLAAHKAEIVGTEYPEIDTPDVSDSRIFKYKAADGLELEGVLTVPNGKAAKDLPLVVLPHGGPEDRDNLGFDSWSQAFAHRGYAVFQPNYRGSSGFGLEFRDAGFGQWGRKMRTDISDGVAALAREGLVDPKRACIVGASYGGYAALAGVTVQHGLYRCAVAVAGVSDLNDMLHWETDKVGNGRNTTSRYWRRYMGAASDGDPSLRAYSPFALARQTDAPILLIHGTDDTTVPVSQSQFMARALRGAGKTVEYIEIPGEDHQERNEAARIQTLIASVAFVEKYNPAQ
jgi:dipeptidyl aminopeptidase/acylaminoacyl peptidase